MFLNNDKKSLLNELDKIVKHKQKWHFNSFNSYDAPSNEFKKIAYKHNISNWKELCLFMNQTIFELKDSKYIKKNNHYFSYEGYDHSKNPVVKDFVTQFQKVNEITDFFLSICLFALRIDYTPIYNFFEKHASYSSVNVKKEFETINAIINKYSNMISFLDDKKNSLLDKMDDFDYLLESITRDVHLNSGIHHYSRRLNAVNQRFHFDINADIKANTELMKNVISEYSEYYKTNILDKLFNADELQEDRNTIFNICKKLFVKLNLSSINDDMAYRFILNKTDDSLTDNILMMSVNIDSFIEKAIVFDDLSIAYRLKGAKDYSYFFDYTNTDKMVMSIFKANLRYIMRKNPNIQKAFINIYESWNNPLEKQINGCSHQSIYICIDSYFKNEGILKSKKYDLINKMKTFYTLEQLDDDMHAIIREHKFEQYANSIISNKYKPLYNKTTYKSLKVLFDMNISRSVLQDMIGKKMAAIKTSKELNDAIKLLINTLNTFTMDKVKLKVIANNAKIVSEDDNILIIEVTNFNQAKVLGSPSWCISRNSYHFENYVSRNSRQLFVYNFNKNGKEASSMIGITLDSSYRMTAGHTKTDGIFKDKELLSYVVEKFKSLS